MPFTMPNYAVPTPQQSSPYANLLQNALGAYQQGIQTRYMPQMIQADIFGKMITPLAQMASNPLFLASMAQNPQQLQNFNNIISNILQNGPFGKMGGMSQQGGMGSNMQQGGNNQSVPQMSSNMGAGGMNGEVSGMGSSGNNDVNQSSDGSAPLGIDPTLNSGGNLSNSTSNLPDQAGFGGALQKATAPFSTQLYPAGTAYRDPKTGDIRTTASPQVLSQTQVGQGAIQVSIPMIKKLQDEGDDVLGPGRFHKYVSSELASALEGAGASQNTLKQWGLDRDYYDKWIQFKSDQNSLIERLQTAYNYPQTNEGQAMASSKIRPGMFENGVAYRERLNKELNLLNQQNQTYQSQGASGFQSTPGKPIESPPKNAMQAVNQQGNAFKNQLIRVKGPDPRDNNKMKIFEIPQGAADQFLNNGYVRAY